MVGLNWVSNLIFKIAICKNNGFDKPTQLLLCVLRALLAHIVLLRQSHRLASFLFYSLPLEIKGGSLNISLSVGWF